MEEHYTRRNRLRYPGHDYGSPSMVHVTICTHGRQRLFGNVIDGQMTLSHVGQMVENRWLTIPERHEGVMIDSQMIMPDHIHGIIFTGIDPNLENIRTTIGAVVRSFKMSVVKAWPNGVKREGWPRYQEHLWQRDFYDTVIRNDGHLEEVRDYIAANPARWTERYGR